MNTPCPHCQIQIEIDPETHAALQGHAHFQCPSCDGLVPVPPAPFKVTAAAAIRRATPSRTPATPSTLASAHRGMNRNFLILGSAALLVLGGLGFFLTSPKSGNSHNTEQRQSASNLPPSKPRIATVEMQKVFKGYYKTAEAQKDINVERAPIQKENNERMVRIKEIETELGKLREPLQDPTLPESRKQELFKEWQAKQQQGVQLDKERREFLTRENQQLNEKMVERMNGIIEELFKMVEEYAKIENYDYASSDSLGLVSTDSLFLAYTGDPGNTTDITDPILKEINKDAPADFQAPKQSQSAAAPSASSNPARKASSPPPKLRIARVDMSKLARAYYKTSEAEKQIDQERARIQQDDERRAAQLRDNEARVGKLRKQLDDPTLPESGKQERFKEWQMVQQEGIALDRERNEFLKRRNQALDEKSRQRMKPVNEEIQKIVIEQCKASGFDFVVDRFAENPSKQGSFLIQTTPTPDGFGPMTDVTDILLEEINKNAPASSLPR